VANLKTLDFLALSEFLVATVCIERDTHTASEARMKKETIIYGPHGPLTRTGQREMFHGAWMDDGQRFRPVWEVEYGVADSHSKGEVAVRSRFGGEDFKNPCGEYWLYSPHVVRRILAHAEIEAYILRMRCGE